MSGKVKFGGLVFAAAFIIMLTGIPLRTAPDDPCGGTYAGEGLKAKFDSQYGTIICNDGSSNVLNDIEGEYYRYFVPGGDCIFRFRAGHVIVGIGNSGRHVVMNFYQMSEGEKDCETMPFATCNTQEFMLRTDVGFTATKGYGGDPNVLVLTSTNAKLDFGKMTAGKTYYCQTSIKFRVADDPLEYQHHFQAKVFYGYVDGILRWVITPIDEPYWLYTVTKQGRKLIPVEPPTWHQSSVYAEFCSAACCYGTYCLPFKLILERLP